jgi:hypothetical protein
VPQDSGTDLQYRVELDGGELVRSASFYTVDQIGDGEHAWRVRVEDQAGNASAWTTMETFYVDRLHTHLPIVLQTSGGTTPECWDIVRNGGFESSTAWIVNPPTRTVDTYVTAPVYAGLQSAAVGHDDAPYSSVRQQTTIPSGASATLRIWHYPLSEGNDPQDIQYVSVWDEFGGRHYPLLANSDDRAWQQLVFDLSDFAGQRISIVIGATNDGDGNLTRAYVDEIELEVCR